MTISKEYIKNILFPSRNKADFEKERDKLVAMDLLNRDYEFSEAIALRSYYHNGNETEKAFAEQKIRELCSYYGFEFDKIAGKDG